MFNNNTLGRKDFQAKQEGDNNEHIMLPKYTTTSRQWAGLKNPRIVRVSKAFGGKDRHSKVCTVKGLRDRRIRLSIPTAIQLYDLQDKLGLSQPSKVIDWLLDSTKDDIDQLPPLQMLLGDFNQFHSLPAALIPQHLNPPQVSLSQLLRSPQNATFVKAHDDIDGDHRQKKGKEAIVENKWHQHENGGLNFFPIPQYSYPGLFPYNPYSNWEPACSNVAISQFGNPGFVPSQTDSSSMALPSTSQLLLGPPTAITLPTFPPFIMPNLGENHDLVRHNNYFHLLNSSSQHVPPNSLMPLFGLSDPQEKVPFGLDAHDKNESDMAGLFIICISINCY